MDEGTAATSTAEQAEPTAPIEFHGRKMMTHLPNEGQMAVIARLSYWDRNVGDKDVNKIRGAINRVGSLLAGLMVDQDDWDWIEDGLASREIGWDEVLDIFNKIADAHGLTNREERRTRQRQGASKARRG